MCAIAWLLVKIVRHPLGQWSLAIILGGGIGNLIDRVRLGYVVDMLDTMFMDFPSSTWRMCSSCAARSAR